MSTRGGFSGVIQDATTYAEVDTWYACDSTVHMSEGSDQLRLYVTNTVADAGDVFFKLQTKDANGSWCTISGSGARWVIDDLSSDPTEQLNCIVKNLNGAGLCTNDDVKVFYKASLNAASAELEIHALAHDSVPWSGPDLEDNGGSPVNVQDQSTPPLDAYFAQSISNFTLSADTVAGTVTTVPRTFEATAGHGIILGDEVILLDVAADRALQAVVTGVAVNTIEIDRPLDHVFPAATALGRIVTSEMAVNGAVTPQIFSIRAGENPTDLVRFIITMLDDTAMDLARFGGIPALSNGLVLRIINGFQKTIFNFKTNRDIKQFCYDLDFDPKAPAGQFGLAARITFGGQDKHGVVLRIATGDVVQWVVQDDLTAMDSLKIATMGHDTTR
jgi:hypothetical protein